MLRAWAVIKQSDETVVAHFENARSHHFARAAADALVHVDSDLHTTSKFLSRSFGSQRACKPERWLTVAGSLCVATTLRPAVSTSVLADRAG